MWKFTNKSLRDAAKESESAAQASLARLNEPEKPKKPKALTKKELAALLSELYRQLSIKQAAVCDSVSEYDTENKDKIWQDYDEIRAYIQKASKALIQVGGIEP